MATGANYVKGTITAISSDGYTIINFGKTLNSYLFFIEVTDESKITIINSNVNRNRAYYFWGFYPKTEINNITHDYNATVLQINPSTNTTNVASILSFESSPTNIRVVTRALDATAGNCFYHNLTYNYYIVEIK